MREVSRRYRERSETYRNLCDPRPIKTINVQSSQVKDRSLEHKYAGNHRYEQENDRNAE